MASLFISYSRDDIAIARRFTEALQKEGWEFWIDWARIPLGVKWWEKIEKGIEETDMFLFLLSPDSVHSLTCQKEITYAAANGKRLIPVVVRDIQAEECPAELRPLNWGFIRAQDDFDEAFQKLMTAAKTDYEWVEVHRELQGKALEWDRKTRENSFLLRGRELAAAELQLATNASKEPNPTDLQREYVLTSRQETERQRRRTNSITTVAIIILAVLTAIAVLQSGIARRAQATAESNQAAAQTAEGNALVQSNARATAQALAEERATVALARQLAAQAIRFVDRRLDKALLLGLEAYRVYPAQETNQLLLNLLESNPKVKFYVHAGQEAVRAVGFSSDGGRFASGSLEGTIHVWNTSNGEEIRNFLVGAANTLAFSPDLRVLAAGHTNGGIDLWDVSTEKLIGSFQHNHESIRSLAFSPDGHVLASGSFDSTISLWNVETGEPIFQSLQGHSALVDSLAFSPDGKLLASGDDNSNIILWDVSNGKLINDTMRDHNSWILSLAFSPDGETLASGGGDHTIILWDLQDFRPRAQLMRHTSFVHSLAFSPDGSILASGGRDRLIVLWDPKTGQPIDQPLRGHSLDVLSLAFHPDNQTLISGGDDTIVQWNINGSSRTGKVLTDKTRRIFSVSLSPDGKILAAGDPKDGSIALWDLERQTQIEPLLSGHEGGVRSLAFSPNGKLLASGGNDHNVILWNLESNGEPIPLGGNYHHTDQVMSVAFSPDGRFLASGSKDKTIIIWSMESYQSVQQLVDGHRFWVMSVAFSPDGQSLAAGDWDRAVWLWDLKTGKGSRLFPDKRGLVNSIAFRGDGQQLAFGGSLGDIYLWDLLGNRLIKPSLREHLSDVYQIAYSPNQEYLASSSGDGTVILWDLVALLPIVQFAVGRQGVTSVAFASDGRTLAAGGCDRTDPGVSCMEGKIVLWNLDASAWNEAACRVTGRNLSQQEWKDYFADQPYHITCPQWPAGE